MPPKRKQTPHNAFYYFMQDFKNKQGRNCRSMQEVADQAGPHWANMSKEQRRPYEERALKEKNHLKVTKMTSEGLDVEFLEQEDRREQEKIQHMKNRVNFILSVAAKSGGLHTQTFFLIHINIFCHCSSQDRYYPAEIGIVGFSLDEGVKEDCVFHRIVKPGALPLGYACEAQMHSKETHQLPPPMTGDTDSNLAEVYEDMCLFIQEKVESRTERNQPILYTEEKLMKMTQQVLNAMSYDYDSNDNMFKIFNLQYMFKNLKNAVSGDQVWPSDTYSIREIEKDVNAHAKGISCELHENSEATLHCSLSIVKRYAFTICDNCCPELQIALIPGKHVPANSRFPSMRTTSMISLNSQSSRYSTLKPTTRDDDTESVVSCSSKSGWDSQSLFSEASSSFGPPKVDSEDFPPLGRDDSWKSTSGKTITSTRSSGSYAGIMGPAGISKKPAALPSSLCDDVEQMRINDSASESSFSSNYPVLGRGRARRPKN